MKRFPANYIAIFALAVGLVSGAVGCSFQSEDVNAVTVENATGEPLFFSGYEKEASHRLDIDPEIPVNTIQGSSLLESGASAALSMTDIGGGYEAGKTLRLFLYEVRSDTARYRSHLDVSYDELERKDFRVEVSSLSGQ